MYIILIFQIYKLHISLYTKIVEVVIITKEYYYKVIEIDSNKELKFLSSFLQ